MMASVTQADSMTAAVEVWRVDEAGGRVEHVAGLDVGCEWVERCRRGRVLESGQGLAGAVLARRVPILLSELDDEAFEDCEAARGWGVRGVLALPVFDSAKLTYVVVFLLRGDAGRVGAVELWAGRRGRFELGLTRGCYVGLERFGAVSRYVNFPRGAGLPGLVWESAMPRGVSGLGRSREFLRSTGAESAGLDSGFGFPVIHRNELLAVMVWLSSSASPLFTRFGVWASTPTGLVPVVDPSSESAGKRPDDWIDAEIIQRSATQRRPILLHADSLTTTAPGPAMVGAVVVPVLMHDAVRAVAAWGW